MEERIGFPHSLNLIPFICYKVRPPDAHGDSGTPDTALTWGERKRVNTVLLPPARQQQQDSAQTLTSVTFDSFKNFSFGPLPINKEYIYGNLGDELVQKL